MIPTIYTSIAYISWVAVGLVWLWGYFGVKSTVARPNPVRRYVSLALMVIGYALLVARPGPCAIGSSGFGACIPWGYLTQQSAAFSIIGVVVDIVGVAFAIWARITLGSNWSNAITLKKDHELIRTGPYAYVRHPIYTGMVTAILGTALTIGTVTSYLGVLVFLAAILIRIHDEDALMAGQFGEAHAEYKNRTKALVPLVW